MPPHNPTGNVVRFDTHALFESGCIPIDLPDEHEPSDERLWTTSELILAAYLAGFVSVMVTVGLALLWAWWLA